MRTLIERIPKEMTITVFIIMDRISIAMEVFDKFFWIWLGD